MNNSSLNITLQSWEHSSDWTSVSGEVIPGSQVASGTATDSPFPAGTIEMQKEFFEAAGVDMSSFHLATINVKLENVSFEIPKDAPTVWDVKWSPEHDAESFSLSPCILHHADKPYQCLVYYPRPETKIGHFKDKQTIEILAPLVPNMAYGDSVVLQLNPAEVECSSSANS